MNKCLSSLALLAATALVLLSCSCATTGPGGDHALASNTDASLLESKSRSALQRLYRTNPIANQLGQQAEGILVFPEIIKGGLVFGGAAGDGTLFRRNQPSGYFRSISASWGLQAGLQKYGYALILMDDNALQALHRSDGWELGSTPNLTVVDKGVATSLSTTTVNKGTYAFFFDQKGLMGGLSLQGTKIVRLAIQP